ncbi:Type I restriction modification DNA specificity domain protein [Romboutsia ilealis]|uniref:Type I restriction modification DNA specificity domain protein n=1 Tax=Romboutsia ilealis TaxID=1115758 RepID=A0A1V1I1B9_9FIRM|nr:restriction endonuclease subunit S [Romboutsia ilealis]CED93943.1 Type I restriction modification DNA specificity domain protein [Romboutsia ilealis]
MSKTPKLRFKEFSGDWEEKKLGTLGQFLKGSILSKADLSEEGKPCVLYGELYTKYSEVIKNVISKTNLENDKLVLGKKNDVLIPSSGETAIDIATASCLQQDNVILGGDLNVFRSDKVNGVFTSYQLNSSKKREIARLSQGASVVHIYNEQLKKIKLSVPSKEEQEKIASFFSLIDEKISLQSEKVEALKDYKRGMMQKIFSRELRFKDDEGRDYPEWEEKKIKDIFTVTRGVVIAKNEISDLRDNINQYPVYSSQTSNNGILGYDSKYDFEGDYLTWTTDGANAGKVFRRNGKFRCTNVCGVLVEKEETLGFANKMISEFLNKETPKHVSYVGNPKLMNGVMGDIKIKVPILDEQLKIAKILDNIDLKIEKEQEKLDSLNQYKKGLLQQMFV